MAHAACAIWAIDYRRAMRRLDVTAIAFGVAAGAFGVAAGTGPLVGGLAALVLAGLALRARSAEYIAIWAVAPLFVWATFPRPLGDRRGARAGGERGLRAAQCA